MTPFKPKQFTIPKLVGISEKSINEHLKLYAGYVKHANLIHDRITELSKDSETYAYELAELHRRFSFEFGGIKNHEFYFAALEGTSTPINQTGALAEALKKQWDSFELFLNRFKAIALTRGIGWAKLVYDPETKQLLTTWIDEQHIGQLPDTNTILALDMWEHAFVADYQPSGKKQYVEDFFNNINWSIVEEHYNQSIA